MTRLLIAASSAVVRAGLETLVASDPALELAGSFPDLSAAESVRPDVILAAAPLEDLTPPADGLAPAIVLMSGAAAPAWSVDALRLGVRALLPGDATAEQVLAAVGAASSGLALIDPQELETLLPAATPASTPAVLTPREREVLGLMAEGAANKIIAWKLGISEHTVKFHVASILTKLNAATRAEAVARGMRQGMILM